MLSASAPGFRDFTQKGITLLADQSVALNVSLQLGVASEAVTVDATPPQVDITTATLRQVVDSQRMVELPLNGRNAAQLTTLVASAVNCP